MKKITIKVKRVGDPDEGRARVKVLADGQEIAEGRVGGEPEDNTIDRDYDWITGALCSVAKACGAEVEEVDEGTGDDD